MGKGDVGKVGGCGSGVGGVLKWEELDGGQWEHTSEIDPADV